MKRHVLIEDQERPLVWITPRDGFRQVGALRFAAMVIEAVLLIAIFVAGILMLSIQDVRP